MSKHSTRWPRAWRSGARLAAGVAAALALSACGTLSDMLTPGVRGDAAPAMLSFRANVALPQGIAGDVVTLDVNAAYLRRDSSLVPIASQVLRLTSAVLQPVPIPVDIGDCLADPARDGAAGSCAVLLNLALVVNGTVVDRQVIGPLRLTPGQPANVSTPVTLFQLAAVRLEDNAGNSRGDTDTLPMAPGATAQLAARVTDASNLVVTDRAVTWISSATGVVTVSATGELTAVAEGVARITTTLGALSASTMVRVERPAVRLAIVPQPGSGQGRVQSVPAGIDCVVLENGVSGNCAFNFPANSEVTLRSTADSGNLFSAWGNACAAANEREPCVVQLVNAQQVSARFTALRQLSVIASERGDGRGRVVGPNGLDCEITAGAVSGSCTVTVPEGTNVTLTGTAAGVLDRFAAWGSSCANTATTGEGATCTVPVRGANAMVSAGFFGARTLSVVINGSGNGVVQVNGSERCTRDDNGVLDGGCEARFAHETVVSLTAVPNARSTFVAWTGACTGSAATCTVTMQEARTVTATMQERLLTLTVVVGGDGAGALFLNGESLCAAARDAPDQLCERVMRVGDTITLTGTAGEFSLFDGFSSAPASLCRGTGACTFVAETSVVVRGEFSTVPASITMRTSPQGSSGSGLVESNSVNGILCEYSVGVLNGRCSTSAALFAPVELTATPGISSVLLAWGGACAGATTTTCVVRPEGAETVSARFTSAINVSIEIPRSNGTGVVSFSVPDVPSPPVCPTRADGARSCRYALPVGASGVFRAEPGPGSTFLGFSGPCLEGTGPVPVCTFRGFGFVRRIDAVFSTTP